MSGAPPEHLKRVLSLPLVVLYGLGITIGAGIYVLVGETAGRAGMMAPLSFLVGAVVMLFPALCFAELSSRFPFASGAARFVEESSGSRVAGLFIGLLVIAAGLIGASTISLGAVRYLGEIVSLPPSLLLAGLLLLLGMICVWGVKQSVLLASMMTLIEVGGLLAIILGGMIYDGDRLLQLHRLLPPEWTMAVLAPVLQASLLAFFAFIGFEGISNISEETVNPRRTLPLAMVLTLAISALVYALVVSVAVLTVGPEDLASQQAPLSHVFQETTGLSPSAITMVAVVATLNGVIVQIIMISRLVYGLSSRGQLPAFLGGIHPVTRTPVAAIAVTVLLVLGLALALPVVVLAEWTSRLILFVFAVICGALLRLKLQGREAPPGGFEVHWSIPAAGVFLCALLLIADVIVS